MDLKAYYRRIREIEASFEDDFPVVRSLPTESGGQGGRLVETSRSVAARMIVDGVAELADPSEAKALKRQALDAQRQEQERRKAAQVQFAVLSEADLRALTQSGGKRKE
ncbi:MAG: hypothetical protein GC160_19560 [Acidobacteria bacterium]|nr:hypothetical protein [Acidobacteriota bacterium]